MVRIILLLLFALHFCGIAQQQSTFAPAKVPAKNYGSFGGPPAKNTNNNNIGTTNPTPKTTNSNSSKYGSFNSNTSSTNQQSNTGAFGSATNAEKYSSGFREAGALYTVNDPPLSLTSKIVSCDACNGSGSIESRAVCSKCHGAPEQSCSECRGVGKDVCSSCDGAGKQTCEGCYGRGSVSSYDGSFTIPCFVCGSSGRRNCESCNGTGYKKCYKCSGKGKIICNSCGGEGEKKSALVCPKCSGAKFIYN